MDIKYLPKHDQFKINTDFLNFPPTVSALAPAVSASANNVLLTNKIQSYSQYSSRHVQPTEQ